MTTTTPQLADKCRDIERVIFGDDLKANSPEDIKRAMTRLVFFVEICGGKKVYGFCGSDGPMSFNAYLPKSIPNKDAPICIWVRRSGTEYASYVEQCVASYRRPPRNFADDTPEGLWLCHRVLIPAMSNEQRREFALRLLHVMAEQEPELAHNEPVLAALQATPAQIVEAAWRAIGGSDGTVSR